MNLVFVNQFYPPDLAPTGGKLQDLARELVRRGHRVRVLASHQTYAMADGEPVSKPEAGVEVVRLAAAQWGRTTSLRRVLSLLSFAWRIGPALRDLGSGVDGVVCLTSPPFVAIPVSASVRRLGIPVAYWFMDVYPEALFAAGWLKRDGLAGHFLAKQMATALRSYPILTLSREMAKAIGDMTGVESADYPCTAKSGSGASTPVIQWNWLWADEAVIRDPSDDAVELYRRQQGWLPKEKVVLYSGNMGRGHDIRHLLEVVRKVQDEPDVRWVFAGSGPLESEVRAVASHLRPGMMTIMPYCPSDMLGVHLRAADIHLAGLAPGWESVMLPSKIANSFAARRPVMLIGARWGVPGLWITESGGGWHQPEADVVAIRRILRLSREECRNLGQNGRRYMEQHFNSAARIHQVSDWVEGCFRCPNNA